MHKAALILSMGAATATLCLGAAVVLAGGAATDAAGPPALAAVTPERAAVLEHIVIQDCGSCHGLTMKGGLGTAITPADLAGRDPEGLAEIILDGLPGTAMPPWRPLLSEADARWIADYLLTEKDAE